MISLTLLCDEYIDRPNFSEQKNTFEYLVPAPDKWGRNNYDQLLGLNIPGNHPKTS